MANLEFRKQVSLRPYTTLRSGGNAEQFVRAVSADELASVATRAFSDGTKLTVLGSGSNMLPSDAGVPGLVVLNEARKISVDPGGEVLAETGCQFQELFLKTAQANLTGLQFAVGIPGTLGGALVSNAGAYRSDISALVTEVEIVHDGVRKWVEPGYLQFSYRDSILRKPDPPQIALLQVRLNLEPANPKPVYDAARDYQRQRIGKQPPSPSAGSFFKNVVDADLAQRIDGLTDGMRAAGVVPAGFLIEACGLKGHRYKGAMVGQRHANFLLNVQGAKASAIRKLAEHVAARVYERFGVQIEEEVLYLGDWSGHVNDGLLPN